MVTTGTTGAVGTAGTIEQNASVKALVDIRELTHVYHTGTRALDGVSISVKPGEFLCLLGPSGAGKSTLLRCINGLIHPTSGDIIIDGKPLDRHKKQLRLTRSRIGFVFQQFNLVGRLTVLQNVLSGRLADANQLQSCLYRFSRDDIGFAMECLERVGMQPFSTQRAEQLSGGQQQRVAIARALAQRPKLILADEPVASLDPMNAARVMEILGQLGRDNLTIICNLHQVDYARVYANRIACLSSGKLIYEGSPASLTDDLMSGLYGIKLGA